MSNNHENALPMETVTIPTKKTDVNIEQGQTEKQSWRQFLFHTKKTKILCIVFLVILVVSALVIGLSVHYTSDKRNDENLVASDDLLVTDINVISQYWGYLRPYSSNVPSYFGVTDTGLPDGCQIEQIHVLHRHGARFPAGHDLITVPAFAKKITDIVSAGGIFKGPLTFLNTWSLRLGTQLLVPNGAAMEYQSGVDFWNENRSNITCVISMYQYFYEQHIEHVLIEYQAYYDESGHAPLFFRTSGLARTYDSLTDWAAGFFGPYNTTYKYSILSIPMGPGSNNTLASYTTCLPFADPILGSVESSRDLSSAAARINSYVPSSANFSLSDIQMMQMMCIYETIVLSGSDFCNLFTLKDWQDLGQKANEAFYNAASFGSQQGRARGIGYLEELIARLTNTLINVSDSSVNSTLDSSETTFPLNQPFYTDMSHEYTILSVLTAMSLDYFRENVTNGFPPSSGRHFQLSYMTPLASRLITEKIGCISPTPSPTNDTRTQYSRSQYGYSPTLATNKFIRMRLNNGILPLHTIRGGLCSSRTDGLCPMDKFIAIQNDAKILANYQYVCFANFTINANNFHNDGTVFP